MQQSLICENTKQNTEAFLEHLKSTLKNYFSPLHHAWVESLSIILHTENEINIAVSQQSFLETINRNQQKFEQIFFREYESFFNTRNTLTIVVQSNSHAIMQEVLPSGSFKKPTHLEPKFTFQTFITTNENIFTKMNIEAVSNKIKEGQNGNFVCITGTIGNGKTHLLQSIGNSVEKHISVQYMTSERFMFLYTKAVAQKNLIQFREAITEAKLLLIDDIHFILAKDGTIKELASTIRYILSFGGNIAITSATSLHAMQGLAKDIQDTFSKANVINIENPSMQLRYEILEYKNRAFGYNVSQEVLTMLADKISSNIRDLETTFDKIILHGRILNNIIDVNAAKMILKEIFPSTAFKSVSIKTIIENICNFYGIKKEDIISQSRLKEFVVARQMGMYLAMEMTNETSKKIGFEFGGRTHSTVIHAYKTIKEECNNHNTEVIKNIELLKVQIYGS
jgi:chromosomal replication initiator protein